MGAHPNLVSSPIDMLQLEKKERRRCLSTTSCAPTPLAAAASTATTKPAGREKQSWMLPFVALLGFKHFDARSYVHAKEEEKEKRGKDEASFFFPSQNRGLITRDVAASATPADVVVVPLNSWFFRGQPAGGIQCCHCGCARACVAGVTLDARHSCTRRMLEATALSRSKS